MRNDLKPEIDYKNLVAILQKQIADVQEDLSMAIEVLEKEQRSNRISASAANELVKQNQALICMGTNRENELKKSNDDFFCLGDMFMATIEKEYQGEKMNVMIDGAVSFMEKQYQSRIEYLEELVFEIGDEIQDCKKESVKTVSVTNGVFTDFADVVKNMKKDIEDIQADMAEYFSEMKKDEEDFKADAAFEITEAVKTKNSYYSEIGKMANEINLLKSDAEIKEKVRIEGIYADKKCKYDLEQKIASLEKENQELKVEIEKLKKEDFEEDRKQIVEEIKKADVSDPEKSVTARELAKKYLGKAQGKDRMLDIKNKLCNKGYEVQDTGKSLLAKKPGNSHIEVKPAELPGSFKYIICGQTCYEFDQAIKASTYGAKAIAPKLDAEAIS